MKFAEVVASGRVKNFLKGADGMAIFDPYSDYPTDTLKVFDSIELEIIQSQDMLEAFLFGLLELSEDADFCWLVMTYIWKLKRTGQRQGLDLFDRAWLELIRNNLKLAKPNLKKNHKWVGADFSNGLWGEVLRLNANFAEDILILPDEL